MHALRRINNNVVFCLDSQGRQVVAIGKGIGFGNKPKDIPLSAIERTFYEVDVRYLEGIANCPKEVLDFSAQLADRANNELQYELSPNLVFTLADHIAFAIKRSKDGINITIPLALDIEQSFPSEYRIGRQAVRAIRKKFGVWLDGDEAAGIAMNFINSRLAPKDKKSLQLSLTDKEMLNDITELIENSFDIVIDKDTFAYARFATHLNYLFQRIHEGKNIGQNTIPDIDERSILDEIKTKFPKSFDCTERITLLINTKWEINIPPKEKLYLLMHISRFI